MEALGSCLAPSPVLIEVVLVSQGFTVLPAAGS